MNFQGCVIAIGGAEDKIKKRAILSEFVRRAGGKKARIAILPSASTIPEERGALYASIFSELGAAATTILDISDRHDANSHRVVRALHEATGVFVTGGVQLRLIAILGGTEVGNALLEVVQRGGVYCGTSAGAAAISTHMIITGTSGMRVRRSMVDVAPGLGLLSGIIIDQHFSQRARLGRLIAAVGTNPQLMGIGIDEDTAAIFCADDTVEVIGSGQVVVVDASKVTRSSIHSVPKAKPFSMSPIQIHLLTEGDRFDLKRRAVDEGRVVELSPVGRYA